MLYKAYTKCSISGYVVIATWSDDAAASHFIAAWHPTLKKLKQHDIMHFVADINATMHEYNTFVSCNKRDSFDAFFVEHPHFVWMKDIHSNEWMTMKCRGKQIIDEE